MRRDIVEALIVKTKKRRGCQLLRSATGRPDLSEVRKSTKTRTILSSYLTTWHTIDERIFLAAGVSGVVSCIIYLMILDRYSEV